jgi:hypothetical protein
VQAYCFSANPDAFLEDYHAVKRKWAAHAKQLIVEKMRRLIGYIQKVDHCIEKNNAEKGKHFSGFVNRLKTGLPALPKKKNLVLPGKVIARRPSITNISAAYASTAMIPFKKHDVNSRLENLAIEFARDEAIKEESAALLAEPIVRAPVVAAPVAPAPIAAIAAKSIPSKQSRINNYFKKATKNKTKKNNKNQQ